MDFELANEPINLEQFILVTKIQYKELPVLSGIIDLSELAKPSNTKEQAVDIARKIDCSRLLEDRPKASLASKGIHPYSHNELKSIARQLKKSTDIKISSSQSKPELVRAIRAAIGCK